MRNRCASLLILFMLMVALAIPASASYSAADVVNYFMKQDMGNVHWTGRIDHQSESWIDYSATAEVDGHVYRFFITGGQDDGQDVVYDMGISGWYPDLELKGRESGGYKVYKAFLETLVRFLPDSYELREIYKPENIYSMLSGGYSFNYQPKEWCVNYNPQYGSVSSSNGCYLILHRRTEEDEVTLTNYFSFYYSFT